MQMADPGGSGYTERNQKMGAQVHAKQRILKLKQDWA
jgi:hypothetical protein